MAQCYCAVIIQSKSRVLVNAHEGAFCGNQTVRCICRIAIQGSKPYPVAMLLRLVAQCGDTPSACVSPSWIPNTHPRDSDPGSLLTSRNLGPPLLQANARIVGRLSYESSKGVSNPFLRIPLEDPQERSTSVDLKRTCVLIYAPCRFASSGLDSASGSTRTLMISRRSTSVTSATSTGLSSPTRSCRLRNISSGCRTTSEPSSWFNCRSGAWTTHPRRSSFDYLKSSLTVYLKGQMQRSRVGS